MLVDVERVVVDTVRVDGVSVVEEETVDVYVTSVVLLVAEVLLLVVFVIVVCVGVRPVPPPQ